METKISQDVTLTVANPNTEMKQINYPITEKAGVRDWISNYYFDLSVYNFPFINKLTKVVLYQNQEHIAAMEFFYDGLSTGLFHGKDFNKSNCPEIEQTCIDIPDDDMIQYAQGSFNVDYITGITFCMKSGAMKGFCNKSIYDKTDNKYFMFYRAGEGNELIGLNLAFGKYLTYISPNFREKLFEYNQSSKMVSSVCNVGKKFPDSIDFALDNDILERGIFKGIKIFHDNALVSSIEIIHLIDNNLVTSQFGKIFSGDNLKFEELILGEGEFVEKITVRAGDMIDNITMMTSRSRCISAGGIGGRPFLFDLKDIRKEANDNSINFVTFEGSFFNTMHTLLLKFK